MSFNSNQHDFFSYMQIVFNTNIARSYIIYENSMVRLHFYIHICNIPYMMYIMFLGPPTPRVRGGAESGSWKKSGNDVTPKLCAKSFMCFFYPLNRMRTASRWRFELVWWFLCALDGWSCWCYQNTHTHSSFSHYYCT